MSDQISIPNPVVTPPASTPATPATPAQPAATPERPAWLPDKFTSGEELAKSYAELEKKLGAQKPADPPAEPPKTPETPPAQPNKPQITPDVMKSFEDEYLAAGALSEDSYKKLAEQYGVSKEIVDNYVAGRKASATTAETEFLNSVGGKDAYEAMAQWAVANLPPTEVEAYDRIINSGNMASMKFAADAMMRRYSAAVGKPASVRLTGSNGGGTTAFKSDAEMIAAMRDPRYKSDPEYRKEVGDRLAAMG